MACVVVVAGFFASSALAAFPGRDGLLAVQPLQGSGIVLVGSNGRGERRVCPKPGPGSGFPCVLAGLSSPRPEWSPDGRSLVVSGEPGVNGQSSFYMFYPDGTCLECQLLFHGAGAAAFTSGSTLFTAVFPVVAPSGPSAADYQLVEFGVDGLARKVLMSGSHAISDPVRSSRGELAIVRGSWIWVGQPGELHRLTLGTSPSWSPRGTRLAFNRRGWVRIVSVGGGGSSRRLVRGTSPAWSPDGRSVAFFGVGHQLEVIGAGGGRERRIGRVTGRSVDWQPLPAGSPAACQPPPDSTVIADGSTASVTLDTGLAPPAEYGSGLESTSAYMGCLKANGHRRLLYAEPPEAGGVILGQEAAVTGNYAALAINYLDGRYDQQGGYVDLFDLRTGCELSADTACDKSVHDRAGEDDDFCGYGPSPPCTGTIDQLILGNDAITAVHSTQVDNGCNCTVEQIQASDSTGVRTLDSATEPDGSPPELTNLTLTGDTLTWEHGGGPQSAQLTP